MAPALMNRLQQHLEPGRVVRWVTSARPRRLAVTEGRVWVTGTGVEGDLWLQAGDELVLPAGVDLLAEGWPSARFEWVESLPRARRFSVWRLFSSARRAQPACA